MLPKFKLFAPEMQISICVQIAAPEIQNTVCKSGACSYNAKKKEEEMI